MGYLCISRYCRKEKGTKGNVMKGNVMRSSAYSRFGGEGSEFRYIFASYDKQEYGKVLVTMHWSDCHNIDTCCTATGCKSDRR